MSDLIGIAGSGVIAQALGRLLAQAGEPVSFLAGRSPGNARAASVFIGHNVEPVSIAELPARAARLLIAVSDDALESVAALLADSSSRPGLALHTCGSRGPEALAPLSRAGYACGVLHPLQSVPSADRGVASLAGSYFGVCGGPRAATWAGELIASLRGEPLPIAAKDWALYHAAAVIACNYQATLLDTALGLLETTGLPRDNGRRALAGLLRMSLSNILEMGPERGLTGPLRRGDTGTIRANLEAVAAASPSAETLYRTCGLATIPLAIRAGLPPTKAAEIERLLRQTK